MEFLLFVSIICLITSFMLIWFNSDAFVEWIKFFGLGKIIKYQEYLDAKLDNFTITYPLFLKLKYKKFIFKILGCPLCLNTWMSLFGGIFMAKIVSESMDDFIIKTIMYYPIILILSIYIYCKISKLLNENK